MEAGNIFKNIPARLDSEQFDVLLQSEHVTIERIVSRGHRSPVSGWYEQERDEWVMVLQGAASISFEHEPSVSLLVGDYLNIPALCRHKSIMDRPRSAHSLVGSAWLCRRLVNISGEEAGCYAFYLRRKRADRAE